MRVVISGVTSMSGAAIVEALLDRGASVTAFTRTLPVEQTSAVQSRISSFRDRIDWLHGVRHGTEELAEALRSVAADTYIVHAHPMENYKSRQYDIGSVLSQMVLNLSQEVDAFAAAGGRSIVYSSSVFEPNTQLASQPNTAASLYGLSKNVVYEALRMDCRNASVDLKRVVIPNPFGPGERGRFGNYLIETWAAGSTPVIRTPDYIRDNIPVRELAERYADLVMQGTGAPPILRPSGYIESQLAFAQRTARELGTRLDRELLVESLEQVEFPEPVVLINDGSRSSTFSDRESQYWDEYADFLSSSVTFT